MLCTSRSCTVATKTNNEDNDLCRKRSQVQERVLVHGRLFTHSVETQTTKGNGTCRKWANIVVVATIVTRAVQEAKCCVVNRRARLVAVLGLCGLSRGTVFGCFLVGKSAVGVLSCAMRWELLAAWSTVDGE